MRGGCPISRASCAREVGTFAETYSTVIAFNRRSSDVG